MGPLECDHLVVGAGSTGLAVADQLLRREMGSVIVIDSLESPQARTGECRAALLYPDVDDFENCAKRGYELYEGWSNWLEVDPEFRRSGALFVVDSAEESSEKSHEILNPEEMKRRWSALGDRSVYARFDPRCGTVDGQSVHGALMWRMRHGGGRFHGGSSLSLLDESESGVHFMTSRREGVAGKVYLCQGPEAVSLMASLGSRHRQEVETVSEFTLNLEGDFPPVIDWGEEGATLFATEAGTTELHFAGPSGEAGPGGHLATPAVDWDHLSRFRSQWSDWIPGLNEAVILKARARHRRAWNESSHEIASSSGGRIVMPGCAGQFQELLFPALAEYLIEQIFTGQTGGLLEDLED
ncbi:MAG: hypothetical protein CBC13_07345 [Planctomycetia bacterium TMED53]|nr:MAG: hypothetical protein CBC13_07345 [Planctomycetia bacterium TMED53]